MPRPAEDLAQVRKAEAVIVRLRWLAMASWPLILLAAFLGFAQHMQSIAIDTLHVAANGGVVFTERVDRFRSGTVALALPVAGVFEVRDGKIVAHRDYFDYRTWLDATGIPLG